MTPDSALHNLPARSISLIIGSVYECNYIDRLQKCTLDELEAAKKHLGFYRTEEGNKKLILLNEELLRRTSL